MLMNRQVARKRRHQRIRKKIAGTAHVPRLCVVKSLKHLTAQLVDDSVGKTLAGISTYSPALREKVKRGNREAARLLGQLIAEKAKELKVERVVFDRAGCLFHGRVRAVAEAAREAGLKF